MIKNISSGLCVSLTSTSLAEIRNEIAFLQGKVDWIEIRLDRLATYELDDLKFLIESSIVPLIWTLRTEAQGGFFKGTAENLYDRLVDLCQITPAYVDIEFSIEIHRFNALKAKSPSTRWLLSYHDFDRTPIDLDALWKQMSGIEADYFKMAFFAHTTLDALRILIFTQRVNLSRKNFIGIGMGEKGELTRILAPLVQSPWTYVCLNKNKQTAPGQMDFSTMKSLYRHHPMDSNTSIYGLIGDPVVNSRSHRTHNMLFNACGINALYVKFPLKEEELSLFFQLIKSLNIKGLSVTMPLKGSVQPWITHFEDTTSIEACNTLCFDPSNVYGKNTDGPGAMKTLESIELKGKRVIVLGAGGTAAAIVTELIKAEAVVTILNRTAEKAKLLAEKHHCLWGSLEAYKNIDYDILIQTTAVGMAPNEKIQLIDLNLLKSNKIVFDVISNPVETSLLKEAKRKGCKVFSGGDLFVHQAVIQICWWLNDFSREMEFENILRQAFKENEDGVE